MKRQKGANNANQSTRQRQTDMKKINTDMLSLCFPSRLAHAYTHKAFFRLKSRTTLSLERYQLVSFRKKDAKIGIGKGFLNLTPLWLRTILRSGFTSPFLDLCLSFLI